MRNTVRHWAINLECPYVGLSDQPTRTRAEHELSLSSAGRIVRSGQASNDLAAQLLGAPGERDGRMHSPIEAMIESTTMSHLLITPFVSYETIGKFMIIDELKRRAKRSLRTGR
jgi:hypothetical protein